MLAWILNLDYAASVSDVEPEPTAASSQGTPLLLGTGCLLAPILAAALLGVL